MGTDPARAASLHPQHSPPRIGASCATVSPPKVATNTTHSPDGANSSTGKPANFDASNAGTTNEHAKQGNEMSAMSDPGWVQPPAHAHAKNAVTDSDADIAVILAAADHTQTFEDLLSIKDRDAFINWLDDHED